MTEECFPLLAILGVVLLAAAMMYGYLLAAHKRTVALAQVANQLNFTFAPKDAGNTFLSQLSRSELCRQRGRDKRVTNLMRGTLNGVEIDMFDYTYLTGGGKHTHVHTQSVLRFKVKAGVSWPSFFLRQKYMGEKIGLWPDSQDINFADYPTFSKHYLLHGADEAAVRAIFTPQVLSFYERLSNICNEAEGPYLLYYRSLPRKVDPGSMVTFLREGMAALSQFCPSVSADVYLPPRTES